MREGVRNFSLEQKKKTLLKQATFFHNMAPRILPKNVAKYFKYFLFVQSRERDKSFLFVCLFEYIKKYFPSLS